jgi:hypothetical protein
MRETSGEAAARLAGGESQIETRRSWTGGLYHDLNANLKLVAEYTHASSDWLGGQSLSAT